MFVNNPYAQGGWTNHQNSYSINGEMAAGSTSSQPPTYGALPCVAGSQNGWVEFKFHYRPDILNCIVTGPQGAKAAEIRTVSGQTTFSGNRGIFSTIQWVNRPTVEIYDFVRNQFAGDFLSLQSRPDGRSYRRMEMAGKSYRWLAKADATYLYKSGSNTEVLARCRMSELQTVVLELKPEAFPASLLQPCITATVLLFSGHYFD